MKLGMELLERRNLLSVDLLRSGDTLSITGSNVADVITVDEAADGTLTVTDGDTVVGSYAGINNLNIYAGNGYDTVTVNSLDTVPLLNTAIYGGNGNDNIQGGGGNDRLYGENGDDLLTNFVTDANYNPIGRGSVDILDGGNGNDSLWGGWGASDTLLGGNGDDLIYDIVGGSNRVYPGAGNDWTINRGGAGLPTDPLNNPGALISDTVSLYGDDRNVLFDAATQAAGPVVIDNVLYVLNLGSGSIQVDQNADGSTSLNYNGQLFSYAAGSFTTIAGLGGNGSDTFTNNTNISSVFYGQGGDDVLTGGWNRDVLKGGNGNDTLNGRAGADDITGDAGSDTLLARDGMIDTVRVDLLDLIFADLGDRLVVKKNLAFA